ncbi:50S ribosomal protein L11 methyltransferase [soil metagenome]
MGNWTGVVADLSLSDAERLAEEIENRAEGVQAVSIAETNEARGLWSVTAYFATQHEAEACRRIAPQLVVSSLPPIDWVRRSLEGLAPVVAGRFYIHGSHDRARRGSGAISMEIDAATAFGTGHHGTTWGCLMAFDRILKRQKPKMILDLGCGTGVLAIAGALAGCPLVIASDIDPEAVKTSKSNALRNGVGTRLQVHCAPGMQLLALRDHAPYELIFANILARPLVGLAGALSRSLAPGGTLILSGITRDQERWLSATYRNHGLIRDLAIRSGNWVTLVYKRKRPG